MIKDIKNICYAFFIMYTVDGHNYFTKMAAIS
jgi:hypothetical protein